MVDASRAQKDHSPMNLSIMRKLALILLNNEKYSRLSKKKMIFHTFPFIPTL